MENMLIFIHKSLPPSLVCRLALDVSTAPRDVTALLLVSAAGPTLSPGLAGKDGGPAPRRHSEERSLRRAAGRKRRRWCVGARSLEKRSGDNLLCHTLSSVAGDSLLLLLLLPLLFFLQSVSFLLLLLLLSKDNTSQLNIPPVSSPLLLKILSPNQIHQLALTLLLLLLLDLVSVKPSKHILPSDSFSSSSSFPSSFIHFAHAPPSLLLLLPAGGRLLRALSSLRVLASSVQLATSPPAPSD